MKKNFTLVAGFLLALTLQAQRPATANGRGEAKATKVEKAEVRRAAQRSLYAPVLRADVSAARRDSSLATGMSQYEIRDNQAELRDSVRFVYDEYGRRKLELRKSGTCVRYTYQVGPQNMWTERVVEEAYNSSENFPDENLTGLEFTPSTKVVRRINADLQVESEASYSYNSAESKWEREYERTYDYSHLFVDADGELRRGHVVKEVSSYDGESRYQWFEPARQYIEQGSEGEYHKTVVELGADFYSKIEYNKDENDKWVISDKSQYFWAEGVDLGHCYFDYSNGELDYVYGYRLAYEKDKPAAGQFTLTRYDYQQDQDGNLKETVGSKYVVTEGNLSTNLIHNLYGNDKGFEGSYTYYYRIKADGTWQFGEKRVGKSYPNGVWTVTRYDEAGKVKGTDVEFSYRTAEDELEWSFTQTNGDGSCMAEIESAPQEYKDWYDEDTYGTTYAYITPDYQVEKLVYKTLPHYTHPGSGFTFAFPAFYELKEGEDVKLKVADIMDTDGDCEFIRYTYNEEGALVSKENIIKGKVDEGEEYVYSDHKVVSTMYEMNSKGNRYLYYQNVYEKLADGTQQHTQWELDGSADKIEGGRRTETTPDGWLKTYKYDLKQKTFVLQESRVGTVSETLPDGTSVQTEFQQEGDKAVPTRKTENKVTKDGNVRTTTDAAYRWNADSQSWEGEYKNLTMDVEVANAYIEPSLEAYSYYDDEYWFLKPEKMVASAGFSSIQHGVTISYEWDAATKQWKTDHPKPEEALTFTQPDANTYQFVTREWDEGEKRKEYLYQVDAKHRLLVKSEAELKDGEEYRRTQAYSYDERGRLVKAVDKNQENDDTSEFVHHFYYTTLQIFPTAEGIEEAKAVDAGLRIEGRQVVAADSQTLITLYTADGRQVATGRGRVEVPAAGIYVARTAKGSCKLLAR